jgi:hypothetical protein
MSIKIKDLKRKTVMNLYPLKKFIKKILWSPSSSR